ncbi:MAG TPA: M67 family metallopeptidase [Thermomicrobiales bacterium]|nr:M67 family metallopeptidase [Thermomicrobiales bacterium]
MLDTVVLPAHMRETIIAHARHEAPRECCGVIIGPPGDLAELHQMTNTYAGTDFYEVDGAELLALMKESDQRGWEFTAIYHSHPVSVAFPSARDREYAFYPDAVYFICSLEDPETPVLRAFRIVDDSVTELAIVTGS